MKIKSDYSNEPQWKEVTVKSTLPKELACLDELVQAFDVKHIGTSGAIFDPEKLKWVID